MHKFEAGKSYSYRYACDSKDTHTLKVVSRTRCTLRAEIDGNVKTLYVKVIEGNEVVYPNGHYSMAPVARAERVA